MTPKKRESTHNSKHSSKHSKSGDVCSKISGDAKSTARSVAEKLRKPKDRIKSKITTSQNAATGGECSNKTIDGKTSIELKVDLEEKVEIKASPKKLEQLPFESIDACQNGAESSASIEESNRIRARLGIKPLRVGPSPSEIAKTKADEKLKNQLAAEKAEKESEERRLKIVEQRTKREYEKKISGLSLSEKLREENDVAALGAMEWVQKQRSDQQRKQDAKNAARQAALFEDEDIFNGFDVDSSSNPTEISGGSSTSQTYNSADLAGLRITHDSDQFKEGESVILILKDQNILDDDLDAEDTLQNVDIAEKVIVDRNKRRKAGKPEYDPYADNLEMLPQYDEENTEKAGIRLQKIGAVPIINSHGDSLKGNSIQAKLLSGDAIEYSLNSQKVFQSEYFTTAELEELNRVDQPVKLKKRKKKNKTRRHIRTKLQEKFDELPIELQEEYLEDEKKRVDSTLKEDASENISDEIISKNSRSRRNSESISQRETLQLQTDLEEKESRYKKAFEKSRAQTDRLSDNYDPTISDSNKIKIENVERKVDTTIALEAEELHARKQAKLLRNAERKSSKFDSIPDDEIDDEDDLELSLASTRQSSIQNEQESLANRVRKSKELHKKLKIEPDDVVKFSDIEDFVQSLQSNNEEPEEESKPEKSKSESPDSPLKEEFVVAKTSRSNRSINDSSGWVTLAGENEDDVEMTNADDDRDESFLEQEPLASGGVAEALRLVKRHGLLTNDSSADLMGRCNDERPGWYMRQMRNDTAPDVRVEYRDPMTGRPMTRKQAFRNLSHKFHGKMPGKSKTAKAQRELEAQQRQKYVGMTDTPLGIASKLKEVTRHTGQAYVVLDGNKGTSAVLDMVDDTTSGLRTVPVKKPKARKRKRK